MGRIWGNVTESSEISARSGGNLTRSSEISPDPVRSPPDLDHFGLKSTILAGFSTVDGFDRTDRVSSEKSTAPIRLSRRSMAGQNVVHPSPASRSRVGHKPDPWTPLVAYEYAMWAVVPMGDLEHGPSFFKTCGN